MNKTERTRLGDAMVHVQALVEAAEQTVVNFGGSAPFSVPMAADFRDDLRDLRDELADLGGR